MNCQQIKCYTVALLSLFVTGAYSGDSESINGGAWTTTLSTNAPNRVTLRRQDLMQAIRSHDLATVETLLGSGLDPNYLFEKNRPVTPLTEAIAEHQPAIVASLLNHGADVNFGIRKGIVPLSIAAWYDDYYAVSELVRRGARLEARDDEGFTPLLLGASHAKGVKVINFVIASGANIKALSSREGDSALHLAAYNVNVDAVTRFLDLGLAPCARNKEGNTAEDEINGMIRPDEGDKVRALLQKRACLPPKQRGNSRLHVWHLKRRRDLWLPTVLVMSCL